MDEFTKMRNTVVFIENYKQLGDVGGFISSQEGAGNKT